MKSVMLAVTGPKHSPPVVTLFAGAFVSAAAGKVMDELVKMAMERISRRQAIDRGLKLLLDPTEDTQFILGERWGEVAERDRETGLCFLENLPFRGGTPKVQLELDPPDPPEIDSGLYLIGNPVANPLTALFTGNITIDEAEPYGINPTNLRKECLVELPFTFGVDVDPRCEKKSLAEISEIPKQTPPLNFMIKERSTGRMYAPRYNREQKYYDRDYLMLAKIPSIHASSITRGTKCVIIAGCHSIGTAAAQRLLAETRKAREMLGTLQEKAGLNDFQAIFQVFVPESPKEQPELELFKFETI